MNAIQLRQTINQYLDQLSGERLRLVADFINFLVQQERQGQPSDDDFRPAENSSLLENTDIWAGDDFEDCLQTVYETRSQIQA
ncbi:MAG: hypothetical protein AAF282_10935 [Cyanobacteria bacterium P01_A01_bin.15]